MEEPENGRIAPSDLRILHELAKRQLEIAHDPVNAERRRLWLRLAEGRAERPMVLCEGGVAYADLPESELECEDVWARELENALRFQIFQFEKIRDDHVVEPYVNRGWQVDISDFGVQAERHVAEKAEHANVAGYRWDPPIRDLDRDFEKLRPRTFSVDREASIEGKARLEEVFDGILEVRVRGGFWWTVGMTWTLIDLIGLEDMMLYMKTNPEGLHRIMGFLRDEHLRLVEWSEAEGLLTLNNENDYIGSGSMGYTRELPGADWKPGSPVRLCDVWALSESQETVLVGPAEFEEFVFQYQLPVAEKFGLLYYGCCEPVHNRWHVIKRFPNLRRVSVSPWADQEFMGQACGREIVFSRKPMPLLISKDRFDEEEIRQDLRQTLRAAGNCNLEIVMKDVHTLAGEPPRMARWVELAFEVLS